MNFLVSLFNVVSNEDNIYHYPHCPIGSVSWCKYNAGNNAGTVNLLTPKLINQDWPRLPKDIIYKIRPIYIFRAK